MISENERKIIGWFLVTRFVSFLGAGIARSTDFFTIPTQGVISPLLSWPPSSMAAWDSYWYVQIARDGYSALPEGMGQELLFNYAFFPLFPYLMKAIGMLLSDNYQLAGFLVSNVCSLAAVLLLFRFVKSDYGEPIALYTCLLILVFPSSFLISAVMSEGLFLFTTVAAVRLAQSERWLLASCSGMLSALSRSVGVLVAIPILFMIINRIRKNEDYGIITGIWKYRIPIVSLGLIPLGLVLYMTYIYSLTGDFFAAASVQGAWGRELLGVNDVINYLSGERGFYSQIYAWTMVSVILFVVFNYRKISWGLILWTLLMLILPLSNSYEPVHLRSMPRFILVMFPIFIIAAIYFDKIGSTLKTAVLTSSVICLFFLAGSWSIYMQLVV